MLPVPPHLTTACYAMLCYAKSLQSCPTLCDPIDASPPGFPVPGILRARTLEWVAISFSNAWKWKVKVKSLSRVRLLATPWTAAYQAPPSMGFSRQEYWSGVPLPSLHHSMTIGLFTAVPFTQYIMAEYQEKKKWQGIPNTQLEKIQQASELDKVGMVGWSDLGLETTMINMLRAQMDKTESKFWDFFCYPKITKFWKSRKNREESKHCDRNEEGLLMYLLADRMWLRKESLSLRT